HHAGGWPGGGVPAGNQQVIRRQQPLTVLHQLEPTAGQRAGVVVYEEDESGRFEILPFVQYDGAWRALQAGRDTRYCQQDKATVLTGLGHMASFIHLSGRVLVRSKQRRFESRELPASCFIDLAAAPVQVMPSLFQAILPGQRTGAHSGTLGFQYEASFHGQPFLLHDIVTVLFEQFGDLGRTVEILVKDAAVQVKPETRDVELSRVGLFVYQLLAIDVEYQAVGSPRCAHDIVAEV